MDGSPIWAMLPGVMWMPRLALFACCALLLTGLAPAEDDPHAHHDHLAGPNGGRILHELDPHAEVFVTKDRHLRLSLLDGSLTKAVAPGSASAKAICGTKEKPVRMTFAVDGDSLLSDQPLPAGDQLAAVIQIKTSEEAATITVKLQLDLRPCPSCESLEYACLCDHGDADE